MRDFESRWNSPNACGALDGKHVTVRCPGNSGSHYFNYKKCFSIILFAVVDADNNFLYIDVGTNGRVNDAYVYSKSSFATALQTDALNIPPRGIFVGDDAFPLKTNLLKPFPRSAILSERERRFSTIGCPVPVGL